MGQAGNEVSRRIRWPVSAPSSGASKQAADWAASLRKQAGLATRVDEKVAPLRYGRGGNSKFISIAARWSAFGPVASVCLAACSGER